MEREVRWLRPLSCLGVLLATACGTTAPSLPATSADDSARATAVADASAVPPPTESLAPPSTASAVPSADGQLYVNEAGGWSVVVPAGWELGVGNDDAAFVTSDDYIGEIFVAPSSGLTLAELEVRKVDELLSTWPGIQDIESDLVRLPAGDALRITFESTSPDTNSRNALASYIIEHNDRQYVISVRGPYDRDQVLAAAEALATSFALPG